MLDVQLLVGELLLIHRHILDPFVVDLAIRYAEDDGHVELAFETADTGTDPLQVPLDEENFAVAIVKGIPKTIEHRREDGRSRFDITVRTA